MIEKSSINFVSLTDISQKLFLSQCIVCWKSFFSIFVIAVTKHICLISVIDKVPQLWAALERGLPQPLLSILEHFDIDEGGLRYGRSNFMAGHFAYILLW